MSPIRCRLLYQSTSPHLQQLYTGFLMLHRSGAIRLSQERRRTRTEYTSRAPHLRDAAHAHLDAIIDGKVKAHFDAHDAEDIATGELDDSDLYFKRSYLPSLIATLSRDQRSRIQPLGLNYRVLPSRIDWFAARRAVSLRGRLTARSMPRSLKEAFDPHNSFGYKPRVRGMEAPAQLDAEPRVLFLAATYDPHDDPGRARDKIEDRMSVNETRARCIRLLKDELGERFMGGFADSAFARQRYPDLIMPCSLTTQARYIATMRSHPICVATTGLHGSIGWKLAEYVAFSKAIVTEKLLYSVPGDFARDRNYIEFASPDDCAAAATRLIEDRDLRERLMLNNAAYYREYVRPDALVANVLKRARGGARAEFAATSILPSARPSSDARAHRRDRRARASRGARDGGDGWN